MDVALQCLTWLDLMIKIISSALAADHDVVARVQVVSSDVQPDPVDYALRGVDRDLWNRVKAQAASEGRPIRFVLIEFLKVYAEHGFHVVETFNGNRR
jgi:hypothetical protein